MKKLYLTLLLGLFLISFASASGEEDRINQLDDVKQGDCLIIPQTCASCSYVNITITHKNETIISNVGMSDNGASWTYSFCDTNSLGRYDIQGFGDLEGTDTGFTVFWFNVTPSGLDLSIGFYIILIILSCGVVFFGYHIEDAWLVMLGSFAMIMFGLLVLFYGIDGVRDSTYTWALSIITLMIGCYFSIKAGFETFRNL